MQDGLISVPQHAMQNVIVDAFGAHRGAVEGRPTKPC